jgi:predicted ATPase
MITSLQVQNFKGFGATTDQVRFAPITLIYGANTAGKSALIHALLLLQNQQRPHTTMQDHLVFRGDAVDLGSYASAVHRHRTTENIRLGLTWEEYGEVGNSIRTNRRGVTLSLQAYRQGGGRRTSVALSDVQFFDNGNTISVGREFPPYEELSSSFIKRQATNQLPGSGGPHRAIDVDAILRYAKTLHEQSDGGEGKRFPRQRLKRFLETAEFVVRDQVLYESFSILPTWMRGPDESQFSPSGTTLPEELKPVEQLLKWLEISYVELVGGFKHIGPLRPLPNRDTLAQFGQTWFPYGDDVERLPTDQFDALFRRLGLPYTVTFRPVRDIATGEQFHVELQDVRTKTKVSILDTGTGVSQILPLLGELAFPVSDSTRIMLVEQPELHLHPRLQANLAEEMARSALVPLDNTVEQVAPQWVIETHSELFILRLQRLIRKGQLDHRAVSVLYVDSKERTGSTVQELELDEDGEFLDEWPDGFFEEGYRELFQD